MDLMAAALVLGFIGLIGIVTGALAVRKGYHFLPWFLSGGVIGLVALSFLPFANNPAISEMEQRYLADTGNNRGWKIAVVCVGIALARFLIAS